MVATPDPMAQATALAADTARAALVHAAGLAAFIHGYSLLESMRTCRLQTRDDALPAAEGGRPRVNQLLHWAGPTQSEDRDVVTPANDLMYTTAWIQLDCGPVVLTVPPADTDPGRYHVLALYDAWTENFANLGPQCHPGQDVWLLPPVDGDDGTLAGQGRHAAVPAGATTLRCPTRLVWLLARVLVRDADDLADAKKLQARIGLRAPGAAGAARRPSAVAQWQGALSDPVADFIDRAADAEPLAAAFFTNLCRALADAPGPAGDRSLLAWFAHAGLRPGAGFDWAGLGPQERTGLSRAFADGARLLANQTRLHKPRPWALSMRNGRYGHDHMARAVVAHIGLGALHSGEALYGAGHVDAQGQLLDGRTGYRWHLPADQPPPAHAFWSITLYSADRYLYPNPLRRHAIGDRSRHVRPDPDGGLSLTIAHAAPPRPEDQGNWLPAPPGRFYVVLRLYHPDESARHWRIPPLQPLSPHASGPQEGSPP